MDLTRIASSNSLYIFSRPHCFFFMHHLESWFHTCFQWLSATRLPFHFHAQHWFCGAASSPQRLVYRETSSTDQFNNVNKVPMKSDFLLHDRLNLRHFIPQREYRKKRMNAFHCKTQPETIIFLVKKWISKSPFLMNEPLPCLLCTRWQLEWVCFICVWKAFKIHLNHSNTFRHFLMSVASFTNYLLCCLWRGVEEDDEDHKSVEVPPTTYKNTQRTCWCHRVFTKTLKRLFSTKHVAACCTSDTSFMEMLVPISGFFIYDISTGIVGWTWTNDWNWSKWYNWAKVMHNQTQCFINFFQMW